MLLHQLTLTQSRVFSMPLISVRILAPSLVVIPVVVRRNKGVPLIELKCYSRDMMSAGTDLQMAMLSAEGDLRDSIV